MTKAHHPSLKVLPRFFNYLHAHEETASVFRLETDIWLNKNCFNPAPTGLLLRLNICQFGCRWPINLTVRTCYDD